MRVAFLEQGGLHGVDFPIAGAEAGHGGPMADAGPALPMADSFVETRSGVHATPAAADGERLRALVDAHFDFVWRSLRRLGLSGADADDGAQQVFWVLSRKLDRLEAGRERAFLFGIAVRVASDARRAAARRGECAGVDAEHRDPLPGPDELAERHRARRLLDAILDSMPFEMRTAFVLFELEELSVNEIASLCDVPVGTVASRLRRARELFQSAVRRIRARETLRGGGE